jgi:hypothetical protein
MVEAARKQKVDKLLDRYEEDARKGSSRDVKKPE